MLAQRNLILAIIVSILILLGFQYFVEGPRERQRQEAAQQAAVENTTGQSPDAKPAPAGSVPGAGQTVPRDEALKLTPRLAIKTDKVSGSISLAGGRIDDIVLTAFHETVDPNSPPITLLTPLGAAHPYFAEFGWTAPAGASVLLPNDGTAWQGGGTLTQATPVDLTWDNGQGLVFHRRIALDDAYMFTITDSVENKTQAPLTLYSYGLVSRLDTPDVAGIYVLHEGPVGVLDGTLQEHKYKDLAKEAPDPVKTTGGWIGITDKYWLTSVIPDQKTPVTAAFKHQTVGGRDQYQTDYITDAQTAAPGATLAVTNRLFAGAKEVHLLDRYKDTLGIEKFDLAVDFGWFYFLTKPMFFTLDFFYKLVGNFGIAIMILTLLIKALFFPLANRSYRAMAKMRNAQPEIAKLRERFGNDKARQQQELMKLYKEQKINPVAGCLPLVIQIPVFFSLYKVIYTTIEMRHAPFFGWIHDLSSPDPTHLFNLFGLIPWEPPHFIALGAWPVIMGITMFLQQRLNPTPPDPVQQRVFMVMPIVFTFMLGSFPAGLVIYWSWNNLLSIAQQWLIMRQVPKTSAAPPAKGAKG